MVAPMKKQQAHNRSVLSLSGNTASHLPRLLVVSSVSPLLVVIWCKYLTKVGQQPLLQFLRPLDDIERSPHFCLMVYMLIMAFSNWVPNFYMASHGMQFDNKHPRLAKAQLRGLPHRMVAAHNNAIEGLPNLLAGVFAASQCDALDPYLEAALCELVIFTRLLYMPAYYWGRYNAIRTILWATGFFACVFLVFLTVYPDMAWLLGGTA
uniref:MAPEG family protein n=1 Tax=Minutocellus polymorphus TaxID=265543 RepID=A0A7S0FR81_9STRA|mmetsp:Transcript_4831/g.8225  ORF Transcript_4831/g.8225 Transcript_4831/m.8225 type:complete len:208 (+) Transcript_4831:46-669(+)